MAYVAYRGLESWTFIGVAWPLHTAWDVVHHHKGAPNIPFLDDSSFGCAIWCLTGGRSPGAWSLGRSMRTYVL